MFYTLALQKKHLGPIAFKKATFFGSLAQLYWYANNSFNNVRGHSIFIGVVVGLLLSGEDDFTKALIVILTAIIYSVEFFADTV